LKAFVSLIAPRKIAALLSLTYSSKNFWGRGALSTFEKMETSSHIHV